MRRITVKSDKEWLDIKAGVLSGTEVPALFGVRPDRHTPFSLFHEKLGNIDRVDLEGNERVEAGKYLQGAIQLWIADRCPEWQFEWWATIYGRTKYIALHDKIDRLGGSFDGVAIHKETGERRIVEIKTVDYLVFRDQWHNPDTETIEPPLVHLLQGQTYLAIDREATACWMIPLVAGNQLWCGTVEGENRDILIARAPAVVAEIESRVQKFWQDVDAGREPDIDGYEATGRALKQLYPEHVETEKPLNLDDDVQLATWLAERDGYIAKRDDLDVKINEYDNRIKHRLAEIGRAKCRGYKISFKLRKGSTYMVTREPTRVLRITPPKAVKGAA